MSSSTGGDERVPEDDLKKETTEHSRNKDPSESPYSKQAFS